MSLRKNLAAIVLTGALALGSGCTADKELKRIYGCDFKIINGEEVTVYRDQRGMVLTVIKRNKEMINYVDLKNDLELDGVIIEEKNGNIIYLGRAEIGEKDQRQFEHYIRLMKK